MLFETVRYYTPNNYFHSVQVMFCVAGSFGMCLVTLYSFYRACTVAFNDEFNEVTFINLIWCFYYNSFVLFVIYAGNCTRTEVCLKI